MNDLPLTCQFEHHGFAALGAAVFRLTKGDRVAAVAVRLDSSDVVVPLRAIARLFGILPDSADGRMLHLVEQGLRFVPSISLGDPLPSEVLTGEASWDPAPHHKQIAAARLQLQLVNWIDGSRQDAGANESSKITPQMLVVSVDDPSIRPRVQEALRQASEELGIAGGGPAVAALIEELAAELAFIEALRERLLLRVQAMGRRLARVKPEMGPLSPARRETLFQVTRLAATGAAQIAASFDEVDGQTAEIMPALRNLERQRTFLRPHRDRLYCEQLAWDSLLQSWEALPMSAVGDGAWKLVEESYRFLSPRYMTVQEWQSMAAAAERTEKAKAALMW